MLKLLKKNLISFVCILLAVVMAVGGVISYAKFMSGENLGDSTGIGLFSYSATIDGVSALSFTNTAFWGGSVEEDQSEESLVAMNAIRTIDFKVKNFDEKGNVNAVRTGYSITFTAPKSFAEKLAFQVVDNYTVTMTPQIVIGDILTKSSFNTMEVTDYNGDKYVGDVYDKNGNTVVADSENGNGLYFKVTTSIVNGYTAYTATAKTPKGDFVITITQRTETKEQILQFRLWDVSSVTNESNPTVNYEGGKLISPLTVKVEEAQIFYDITVTTPDFQFPAGIATTRNHRVKLVPTEAIDDAHLGGTILDASTGQQATQLYSGQDVLIQTISETVKSYSDQGKTHLISQETNPIFGSIRVYVQGMTNTVRTTSFISKTTDEPDIPNSSAGLTAASTSYTDWTVANTTITGGEDITRQGNSYNEKKPVNGTDYYLFDVSRSATVKTTYTRTVTYTYVLPTPIYETNTYAVTNTQTYVISTTENNGYQIGAEIRETSTVTETYEKKPVGSVIITKTVVETKTETATGTQIGTAYYTRSGYSWQGYTYTLYTGNNSELPQTWGDVNGTTVDNNKTTTSTGGETWLEPTYSTSLPSGVTAETVITHGSPETAVIYKSISRTFDSHSMKIKEVSYTPANDDGTFGTTTVYTQENPFFTMEKTPNANGHYEQHYFVSQCFLKSFPLSVNMTFEQRSSKDKLN